MTVSLANLLFAALLTCATAAEQPAPSAPGEEPIPETSAAKLKRAEAKLTQSRQSASRAQRLFEMGVLARKDLEKAQAELQAAEAELAALHRTESPKPETKVAPESKPKTPAVEPGRWPIHRKPTEPGNTAEVQARVAALEHELASTEEDLLSDEQLLDEALAQLHAELAKTHERSEIHSLAASARQYVGARYRWGGTTSRGFDCSGLIYRLLQLQQTSAPRTAEGLFTVGRPVKKEKLKSGDLVFFKDTYKPGISHVGIYLAEGEFIHASSLQKGVAISKLTEAYYVEHYAGARRLLPEGSRLAR